MASSAIDFYIRKGDATPALVVTPQTAAGTTAPISGTISATIINADTGISHSPTGAADSFTDTDSIVKLRYTWGSSETAGMAAGDYLVYLSAAGPESFPNNDEIIVRIYDGPVGQILTSRADYQSVRDYLGVTDDDLPDSAIESSGFLPAAEAFILNRLALQTGVPTLTQIMAGTNPAVAADKAFLKAAVVYRIAYHFAVGETSAVDTSVTVGPITKDLGGIGASWKDAREESLRDCDQALGSLTGFKRWRVLV